MPELRWVLIGLGLLFLIGLVVWERRKSRRQHFSHTLIESAGVVETTDRARRVEPSFDGMAGVATEPDMGFDVPTIHPAEPVLVALSAGSAVDIPSAARFEIPQTARASAPIQWPPADAGRVLGLRVVGRRGETLSGRTLRIALESAGLRYGPQKIFHLTTPEGAVLASVANLLQPGSFDPEVMDAQELRGLNVFSVLSGASPPAETLEKLVGLARALAQRLGAVVQDADGHDLDGVRLTQLQQTLHEEP